MTDIPNLPSYPGDLVPNTAITDVNGAVWYLPYLELDGAPQRISCTPAEHGAGGTLTLYLGARVDPTLRATARRMPFAVTCGLVSRSAAWQFAIADSGDGFRADLVLDTLAALNTVYDVLHDPANQGQLVVAQQTTVTSPYPSAQIAALQDQIQRLSRSEEEDWQVPALQAQLDALVGTPGQRTYVHGDPVTPSPFVFDDVALRTYLFKGFTPNHGWDNSLVRREVSYGGKSYAYYQEQIDDWNFHYLPDRFALKRDAGGLPLMRVHYQPLPDHTAPATVDVEYQVAAVTDPARLSDAGVLAQLRTFMTTPPSGVTGPALTALLPQSSWGAPVLALNLPAGAAAHPTPAIELAAGFDDTVTLTVAQFQQLWAGLFLAGSVLFQGTVTVPVQGNLESIAVDTRLPGLTSEAVLKAVLDPSVPPQYVRAINVNVAPAIFSGHDASGAGVQAVQINFQEPGNPNLISTTLDAQHLEATVTLHLPITDVLLGKAGTDKYQYQVIVVHSPAPWQNATVTDLWPTVS